ncbi:MAG: redoxin domain-containing protein [Fimbriimonadaceae bacterium]|uniref:Thiol-disulfide oxidoreductase n=1 Tax=Candidatus Nitrosymbiomonas proteolyticus TaxID=2608984 RepID=A0A809R6G8_9BACT|nr:redoxin domain-containing protein [Fimbriimonadaceae bacterium]QYK58079.1 MAG: redoxin domain-containing protein [Fimbriimonadaceae bacterium]BBO23173.1 thiol-disulfide oxidoreductase [Candidatus Nitrosymbiomonas proteolyticus]
MKTIATLLLAFASLVSMGQDTPTDIAKKDLPKEAKCLLCPNDGPEKPAGGLMYKGNAYYFCNTKEIAAFKKDPDAYVPPVLPRPVPEFALVDTTGKTWDAESMKGKLVLVDFWATWCAPCKAMMPMLDKLHARYKEKGFEILSVSIDEKQPNLDKFLKGHKFPNPVLHDDQRTWQKWGVKNIPAMFLVRDGQIIAQWTGKQTEKTLEAGISANLPK